MLACPPSERVRPARLAEGSRSPCPSSLSSLIPSLQTVLRMHCCAGSSCLCGREKLLFGSWAQRGRTPPFPHRPLEGAVRPCSAAVLPFLMSGVRGTQTWGYLYSCSCAIREAAAPAASPSSSRLHSCCSDYISNKRKPSYHAGRLLYSCSGEPDPTLLLLRLPSLAHLCERMAFPAVQEGRSYLDSAAVVRKPGAQGF